MADEMQAGAKRFDVSLSVYGLTERELIVLRSMLLGQIPFTIDINWMVEEQTESVETVYEETLEKFREILQRHTGESADIITDVLNESFLIRERT